jgi:putative SOS response-associated peptidase YedK
MPLPSRLLLARQSPRELAEGLHVQLFDKALANALGPDLQEELLVPGQNTNIVMSIGGRPFLRNANWGFVPYWSSSERAHQTPVPWVESGKASEQLAFRESFRRRRCMVPARAFAPGRMNSAKQRLERSSSYKLFAAIWDCWTAPQGTRLLSFALLARKDVHRKNEHEQWEGIELSELQDQAQWLSASSQASALKELLRNLSNPSPRLGKTG